MSVIITHPVKNSTGKEKMEPQDFTDCHEIKEEKMISLFKSCDNLVLICGLIALCSSVVKLLFGFTPLEILNRVWLLPNGLSPTL